MKMGQLNVGTEKGERKREQGKNHHNQKDGIMLTSD